MKDMIERIEEGHKETRGIVITRLGCNRVGARGSRDQPTSLTK
jgi:hypothetical protein